MAASERARPFRLGNLEKLALPFWLSHCQNTHWSYGQRRVREKCQSARWVINSGWFFRERIRTYATVSCSRTFRACHRRFVFCGWDRADRTSEVTEAQKPLAARLSVPYICFYDSNPPAFLLSYFIVFVSPRCRQGSRLCTPLSGGWHAQRLVRAGLG